MLVKLRLRSEMWEWEKMTAGLFTCGNLSESKYGAGKGVHDIQTQLIESAIDVGLL
jgi:hypothetical protein